MGGKEKDARWFRSTPIIGSKSIGFIRTISIRGKRRGFPGSASNPNEVFLAFIRFPLTKATASSFEEESLTFFKRSALVRSESFFHLLLSLSPRGDCPMIARNEIFSPPSTEEISLEKETRVRFILREDNRQISWNRFSQNFHLCFVPNRSFRRSKIFAFSPLREKWLGFHLDLSKKCIIVPEKSHIRPRRDLDFILDSWEKRSGNYSRSTRISILSKKFLTPPHIEILNGWKRSSGTCRERGQPAIPRNRVENTNKEAGLA